jgi:hypothetical protein
MCLTQVLYRGLAAHVRLGRAELEQHVAAFRVRRRLLERAAEVGDGALRGTARAGAAGCVAQRGDGLWIGGRRAAQKVRGDPLRFGSCLGEEPRGARVCVLPLGRRELLVDGRPDQRVHELERRLGAEDVDPREGRGRVGDRPLVEAREQRRLAWVGVVAQDRDGVRERPRLGREPRQAQRHRS